MFDCYGTLIVSPSIHVYPSCHALTLPKNWEKGMEDKLGPLLEQIGGNREKLSKALGKHETRIQTETPGKLYPEV